MALKISLLYPEDTDESPQMIRNDVTLFNAAVSRAETDMHRHGGVSHHTTGTNATPLTCTAITTFV